MSTSPRIPLSDLPSIMARRRTGESLRQIGESYGLSAATVNHALRKHDVTSGRRADLLTEEDQQSIVRRYEGGESIGVIARHFHVRDQVIRDILIDMGQAVLDHGRLFTEEQEREIVARYEAGEPLASIATSIGGCTATISNVARRHGARRRPRGQQEHRFTEQELKAIADMAQNGFSQNAIGIVLGVSQSVVARAMYKHGIKPAQNKISSGWKGGRTRTAAGYQQVQISRDSPFFCMANATGYVLEHRLVMAQHLGRPLTSDERVHHIDGNRSRNVIENLQLRTGHHGAGQAWVCLDCGSHNIAPFSLGESSN